METFLGLVAKDLYRRLGSDLAEVVVVFPSQRARLFFNVALFKEAKQALWTPIYFSIEELFEKKSPFHKADQIQLIGDLYKTYLRVFNSHVKTPVTETLDEFYYFGEILLSDFDEIDKNLVQAEDLFRNLKDLDVLKDDFSHLSENQKEALKRFGALFEKSTPLKDSFLSVWNILGEIYSEFKSTLRQKKMAYPGMLVRDVIENHLSEFTAKRYVFAGFNALNKSEEKLFRTLKDRSLFYWDYDNYYLEQEAGHFIKQNILKFGSALDNQDRDIFLSRPKEITFMASTSENGQSGVIFPWLSSLKETDAFTEPDSAVVLCNESILPIVMHSIPSGLVENVNITMGFPIAQTPVASFLHVLTELQTKGIVGSGGKFHHKQVLNLLRNPVVRLLCPTSFELETEITENNIFYPDLSVLKDSDLFCQTTDSIELAAYLLKQIERSGKLYLRPDSEDVYDGLYQESIFRAYQIVNRLYGLLLAGEWELEKPTFLRLLRKLLSSTQVPFHGEPIKGLQVMGVLETRSLDFRNVLLLSVNEGSMPASINENTFIPQFLRKHFGLDTFEHQDAIYSYYFYRLLQRAEKITLVYNTAKTGIGKAEMSRYLLQLLVDRRLVINRYALQSPVKPWKTDPIRIEKTEEVMIALKRLFDYRTNPLAKPLTPSYINTFIDCPLRFYLQRIKNYQTEEEFSEELDSSVFGTIFHHAAESIYREIGRIGTDVSFKPFEVRKEDLEFYLIPAHDYLIRRLVSKAFDEVYFKGKTVDESQYNGEQLINFQVICEMLKRLIRYDADNAPFSVCGLEWKVYESFELLDSGVSLKLGGIIDRLQEKNGKMYILDYKTGGRAKSVKSFEELFENKENRPAHIFQTFIYASVQCRMTSNQVIPALLYMQEAAKEDYSPVIQYAGNEVEDFHLLNPDFEILLENKLNDLFNPIIPFEQTPVVGNCRYCDFKEMCDR